MLALPTAPQNPRSVTLNLLPCRIRHSGPIPIASRHWSPQPHVAATQTTAIELNDASSMTPPPANQTLKAHFRGRRLLSRKVTVPDGYEGVIVQNTDKVLPPATNTVAGHVEEVADEDEDEDEDEKLEVKMLEQVGKFDEVMVWGHERIPDDGDMYVRGVEEWIGFAEAMHSYDAAPRTK